MAGNRYGPAARSGPYSAGLVTKNCSRKAAEIQCRVNGWVRPHYPSAWLCIVFFRQTHRPGAQVYVCSNYPVCDSFVMAHPGTLEPMGTLAPPELRRLRYEAHQQFDQLHKSGLMTRQEAYQWLAYIVQAPMSHAHIGHLGEYYCRVVIRESRKLLAQRTGAA
ncbi:MAG: hypothetical protein HFF70_14120 [Oscillospiraceae bacterium]|nr:hypothetical protein [Oscillospiraceae bacterium]